MNIKLNIVYCDHSATTRIKKEVLDEMMPYFSKEYGNASSIYSLGVTAKKAITNARQQVARST